MKRLFLNDFQDFGDELVAAFGEYKPWGQHKAAGGDFTNYPSYSGRILDLKNRREGAIKYFFDKVSPLIRPDVAIAIVPSHDPSKATSGLRELVERICLEDPRTDATGCLVREKKIEKLATGGSRSLDNHLKTIGVRQRELVRGRKVLLLDDVVSTGNSLSACKQLLLANGARIVQCAALAKTI